MIKINKNKIKIFLLYNNHMIQNFNKYLIIYNHIQMIFKIINKPINSIKKILLNYNKMISNYYNQYSI